MTFRYQPVPIVDYWVGAALMLGAPGGSDGKESACSAGDLRSVLGSGRSPGEGNGNPLWYSGLEKPMDGGTCWATVHGVAKSWTRLSDFTFTYFRFHAVLLFTASGLASLIGHIHSWMLFLLWLHLFTLSGVISPLMPSSILGTY